VRTRNGTAVRNRWGWTWLCEHCHRTVSVGGLEDAGAEPQAWAESIDAMHWCAHKDQEAG
jgi:hypothetical protein